LAVSAAWLGFNMVAALRLYRRVKARIAEELAATLLKGERTQAQ
jgi:hypothetical protein